MPSRGRSSKNTLRISIDNLKSDATRPILTRKPLDSYDPEVKETLESQDSGHIIELKNKVHRAIQHFDFENASLLASELVSMHPGNTEYILLYSKALFLVQDYRSALFWLQESQAFTSLYNQNEDITSKSPLMKPLSPWGPKNVENEFNFFNLDQKEIKEKDGKRQFKLFEENEEKRYIEYKKMLEVGYLAVKCLIGCNEKEQALDLIDHFIHEDSINSIFKLAQENRCEELISSYCHTRSILLLEEVRIEEAIFYLKASLRCDPLNLKAKKLLQNYQLSPVEKEEVVKEDIFKLPSIFKNIEPLKLHFSIPVLLPIKKLLFLGKFKDALKSSHKLLCSHPHNLDYQALYVQSLLESENIAELYSYAHDCIRYEPNSCISNYSIGCYYFLKKRFAEAGKNLLRATKKNKFFAPAWFMFGKCFSKDGISNKAFAVYEFASTLFSGSYLFALATALEYVGQNNSILAVHYLFKALQLNDENDPVVHAHIGFIYLQRDELEKAERWLSNVLDFLKGYLHDKEVLKKWRPTIMNYGNCLLKQNKFQEAIEVLMVCLTAQAGSEVYLALGICHYSLFKLKQVIDLRGRKPSTDSTQGAHISKSVDYLEQALVYNENGSESVNIVEALENAQKDFLFFQRERAVLTFDKNRMENVQGEINELVHQELLDKIQHTVTDSEEQVEQEEANESFFQPASKLYSKLTFDTSEENNQSYIQGYSDDDKESMNSFQTLDNGYETPTMRSEHIDNQTSRHRTVMRSPIDSSAEDTQESSILDFTPRTDDISLLSGRRVHRSAPSESIGNDEVS